MSGATDTLDLSRLELPVGGGRVVELELGFDELNFGGLVYRVESQPVGALLDLSKFAVKGIALRLRFEVMLAGPCTRCLDEVGEPIEVEAREVSDPSGGEEMDSPYIRAEQLDLRSWARDAIALTLNTKLLAPQLIEGRCVVCEKTEKQLGTVAEDAEVAPEPDPRWAKLSELKLD